MNKRSYHPLVMFMYFAGTLEERYLKQIPATTVQYWKSIKHQEMYGYDWVEDMFNNYQDLETTIRSRLKKQMMLTTGRIISAFSKIYTGVEYKKLYRKNAQTIVHTIDSIQNNIKKEIACKIFKISIPQYNYWKRMVKCNISAMDLCFKVHPSQLSMEECRTIESAVKSPKNVGMFLSTIYYNLMRNNKLYCGISTFYKYAHAYDADKKFRKKFFKESFIFRASAPFEYLHIDTTKVYTKNEGWQRVVFVKDNYTKAVLHKSIAPTAQSEYIKNALNNVFTHYNLYNETSHVHIVSDDGSENKGEVTKWLQSKNCKHVIRVIANKESVFSNNMVEQSNHLFKNVFMKGREIPEGRDDLLKLISKFVDYNNNVWKPGELLGLSPQEVLDGKSPDKYMFSINIHEAQHNRIIDNRNIQLELCKSCPKVAIH